MMMDVETQGWYIAARDCVRQRHAGRSDALGAPYHLHFERVTGRLLRLFPQATRGQIEAALLHDALEPGQMTPDALRALGVSEDAMRILQRITLPTDGRSYLDYIADLVASGDREAIEVKLADNLDATEHHSSRATAQSLAMMVDTYDPARHMLQRGLIAAGGTDR